MAVGYGRIVIIGSKEVRDFKILFYDYSGNFPVGIERFVDMYLGKYLMNYGIELEPVTINLASNGALNLVLKMMEDDPNERKVILDFSNTPAIKIYVRKLFNETHIPTYVCSLAGDLRIYNMKPMERETALLLRKEHGGFPEIYSRAVKARMKALSDEHLYLLASGLVSGEITMDIQDEENELHLSTYMLGYPFKELGRLKRHFGALKKVAIVGCGALGTFYAIQLALLQNMRMLRLKEVVFVDPDEIELVNFNRQVLFWGDTIGEPKAQVMAERFQRMVYDPVIVRHYNTTFEEIQKELTDVDLIIEGVDRWEVRKRITNFAIEHKIPLITAGVEVIRGHETVYFPNKTYCPYHSINLAEKKDPENPTGCLQIDPSVIFSNMTVASLAILNSLMLEEPLNGVMYYSLKGEYEIYDRFKVDRFSGSCGD